MKPETSKKRPHSALKEASIPQGRKRSKHEAEGHQPVMVSRTEKPLSRKHFLESQSRNKPKDLLQSPPIRGAPRDLVSQSLKDSPDETSVSVAKSEPSLLNSRMFLLYFHHIRR